MNKFTCYSFDITFQFCSKFVHWKPCSPASLLCLHHCWVISSTQLSSHFFRVFSPYVSIPAFLGNLLWLKQHPTFGLLYFLPVLSSCIRDTLSETILCFLSYPIWRSFSASACYWICSILSFSDFAQHVVWVEDQVWDANFILLSI